LGDQRFSIIEVCHIPVNSGIDKMSTGASYFRAPYTVAPYDTQTCVSSVDFKTTAATSYNRVTPHDLTLTQYAADHQRRVNQAMSYKIDPPFQIHLNERETKQRDKIKTLFAIRKRGSAKKKSTTTDAAKTKLKKSKRRVEMEEEYQFEKKPPVPRQAHRAL
jgi:hypothetical protein